MNKFLSFITQYSLISALVTLPVYANVNEEITKTFSVSMGSKFFLDNVNGSVEIHAGTVNEIGLKAIKEAETQEALDNIVVDMIEENNSVTVETKYKQRSSHRNNPGSVRYKITLPSGMDTTYIELVNGSLAVDNIDGNIIAKLVNGSIRIANASGNSEVQSVNGSINMSYTNLNETIEKVLLETVNGSIKLLMPDNIDAVIEAETLHGSLKSDYDLAIEKQDFSGKKMEGRLGNGDIKINLESVNGSIKVMKQ